MIDNQENLQQLYNTINEMRLNTNKRDILIVTDTNKFSSAFVRFKTKNAEVKGGFTKSELSFHLPPPEKVTRHRIAQMSEHECTICQTNFEKNQLYRKSACCKQFFHKKCIDKWCFKTISHNCPLCRQNINNI
jgi:hypothetical protein